MNTERIITELHDRGDGTVKLSHNYPSRPSWKNSGTGRAIVEVTGNPKWQSLDLHCTELPESNKGTKEVYVSVPLDQVIALLRKLGYSVEKANSHFAMDGFTKEAK